MTYADLDGVVGVVKRADDHAERRAGRTPEESSDEERAYFRAGMERFVARDPDGAWVAVKGDRVVGMSEAVRRDGFWGLAMLFVDPQAQSRGIGRRLLDASLTYAAGATTRMIMTSSDPRALRRYSAAGLRIHPAVEAEGEVDRSRIPRGLPGRSGDLTDLDLVEEVDRGLGRCRTEDVEYLLRQGVPMEVVETRAGRGYVLHRKNKPSLLGATDDTTAASLLWRVLAAADGKAQIWCLTAQQDWAVRVALDARLKVVGGGPLFVDGMGLPPGPWIPSGWYF